jgi:tetraacyldisaccharide-1-P 4'-kinase
LDWPLITRSAGFLDEKGNTCDSLSEVEVGLLCAIGSPDRFESSLRQQNLKIRVARFLQDHDPLTAGNLFEDFPLELPIVVTPKDWIKIRERSDLGARRFYIAMRTVEFENPEKFTEWIDKILDEIDA